jgi:hypothetical protein
LHSDEQTLSLLVDVVENVGTVDRSFLISKPVILLPKTPFRDQGVDSQKCQSFRDEDVVIASPQMDTVCCCIKE